MAQKIALALGMVVIVGAIMYFVPENIPEITNAPDVGLGLPATDQGENPTPDPQPTFCKEEPLSHNFPEDVQVYFSLFRKPDSRARLAQTPMANILTDPAVVGPGFEKQFGLVLDLFAPLKSFAFGLILEKGKPFVCGALPAENEEAFLNLWARYAGGKVIALADETKDGLTTRSVRGVNLYFGRRNNTLIFSGSPNAARRMQLLADNGKSLANLPRFRDALLRLSNTSDVFFFARNSQPALWSKSLPSAVQNLTVNGAGGLKFTPEAIYETGEIEHEALALMMAMEGPAFQTQKIALPKYFALARAHLIPEMGKMAAGLLAGPNMHAVLSALLPMVSGEVLAQGKMTGAAPTVLLGLPVTDIHKAKLLLQKYGVAEPQPDGEVVYEVANLYKLANLPQRGFFAVAGNRVFMSNIKFVLTDYLKDLRTKINLGATPKHTPLQKSMMSLEFNPQSLINSFWFLVKAMLADRGMKPTTFFPSAKAVNKHVQESHISAAVKDGRLELKIISPTGNPAWFLPWFYLVKETR